MCSFSFSTLLSRLFHQQVLKNAFSVNGPFLLSQPKCFPYIISCLSSPISQSLKDVKALSFFNFFFYLEGETWITKLKEQTSGIFSIIICRGRISVQQNENGKRKEQEGREGERVIGRQRDRDRDRKKRKTSVQNARRLFLKFAPILAVKLTNFSDL